MANNGELAKDAISEFMRIQRYMISVKDEQALKSYALIKDRYIELKALLQTLGVNLSELDIIKE